MKPANNTAKNTTCSTGGAVRRPSRACRATATAHGSGGPFGGVLGALTTVGQGTLPFTGFPVWVAAVLASVLIGTGLRLRRVGRVAA